MALVAGGYLGAALLACAVVAARAALVGGADRQAAAGMYAFGDSLLFLGAFAVAAVPPTAAALFFLRARDGFWRGLSIASAVLAGTAVPAAVLYYAVPDWSGLAVLRLLVAPALAAFAFLAGIMAPSPGPRHLLLACGATEAAAFASVALRWVLFTIR
jgi:hypothetical protein